MQLEKKSSGDLLELTVRGVLDHDSSIHFRDEIEACARDGWHRILVDLGGVTYLSSAGIAAFVTAKQRLDGLSGLFGIHNATPQVEQVLHLTRVLNLLRCDPERARAGASAGLVTMALSSSTRFAFEDGLAMEIYELDESQKLTCRVIGEPQALFDSRNSQPKQVQFGSQTFGFGLGTLANPAESSQRRMGEFLSISGTAAQSPESNGGLPDYQLASGDFVPAVHVLYGVKCEGDMPVLIRFRPSEADAQVGLSKLVRNCLKQMDYGTAGFVILADCAGLIGAQLRQLPAKAESADANRFALPGVREWLSFSAEHIYRRNLVLIVGIAALRPVAESSPLHGLLRPMELNSELTGHFHAAVFPYRPLKKRTLQLDVSVTELFESGSIQDVLHLLRDDRPITGLGESELLSGACWVGPIKEVVAAEGNA